MKILEQLLQDSTQNYRNIARLTGTTAGTVHNRIRKMRESGILERFTVRVNPLELGYDLCIIMDIQVKGGYLERVQKRYSRDPNICAIYDITGENDTTLVAKFRTMTELNRFVKGVASDKNVIRTSTKIVLNVLKEEPVPTLIASKKSEQVKMGELDGGDISKPSET